MKFVRYLRDFGYEPVVLTGPGGETGRWTPTDTSLESDLPPAVEILRIDAPPPSRTSPSRLERWARVETPFDRWWIDGVHAAASRSSAIDVVCGSMSPFSTADAAAAAAEHLAVPWVADLRDPWALDEMTVYPTRLHRVLERRRMMRSLATAAAIVLNTPEAVRAFRTAFPSLREVPLAAIPNGYDAADFEPRPAAAENGDRRLRIVHTGYLHTELGLQHRSGGALRRVLGGAHADVDFLPRSHVFLLEAVERVLARHSEWRDAIEVQLAGVLSDADRRVIDAFPFPEIVRAPGYVSHAETIELLRTADLLFLPMHDLPPGTRATIVPGKTYEYLAAGRPLLAAVPDGDARDLVAAVPGATVCRPADVDAIAAAIEEAYAAPRPRGSVTPEVARRFERRRLTGDLADVLDRAVAESGSTEPDSATPMISPRS